MSVSDPRFNPLLPPYRQLSRRRETMLAFLNLLQEKYGGVRQYLKHHLGLTDEDIATIRSNILTTGNARL